MPDKATLAAYARWAAERSGPIPKRRPDAQLHAFIGALPASAHVLDLGCGAGRSSALMADAGLRVDALDASPELAELAKNEFGLAVQIAPFDALDAIDTYDGIFANFTLLHAPKIEMPDHISRIARALKPDGLFHVGLKTGTGEARDGLGRFYAYYEDAEITSLLNDAGFQVTQRWFGSDKGMDGVTAPWIVLHARMSA